MIFINLLIAVAPAILLVMYFYRKDSLKKEPKRLIVFTFFMGCVSVIPAVVMGLLLQFTEIFPNPWISSFAQAFITASFVEELAKLLILRIFIFNNKNFDEIMDGIVYMAILSLGFACLENVLYSIDNIAVGLLRAFTAVPGHAIWSGLIGYYVGLAKYKKMNVSSKSSTFKFFGIGLVIGIIYHGVYDFVLFTGSHAELTDEYGWLVFLIVPVLIGGALHLRMLIKKAKKRDQEYVIQTDRSQSGLSQRGEGVTP